MWALPLLPLLGFVLNGLIAILGAARLGPADPSAGGDAHDAPHGDSASAGTTRQRASR